VNQPFKDCNHRTGFLGLLKVMGEPATACRSLRKRYPSSSGGAATSQRMRRSGSYGGCACRSTES